jgi:uncharacterized protein (TIGR03000 family)
VITHAHHAAVVVKPTAMLTLHVPSEAKVYLQDRLMTTRGETRRYRVPVAANGRDYAYQIKVEVPGKAAQTEKHAMRAGKTTELWVTGGEQLVFHTQQPSKAARLLARK